MNAQVTGRGLRKVLYLLTAGSLASGAMAVATVGETPVAPTRGRPGCEPASASGGMLPPDQRHPSVECPESLPQPASESRTR